jgi:hypothetical protein
MFDVVLGEMKRAPLGTVAAILGIGSFVTAALVSGWGFTSETNPRLTYAVSASVSVAAVVSLGVITSSL